VYTRITRLSSVVFCSSISLSSRRLRVSPSTHSISTSIVQKSPGICPSAADSLSAALHVHVFAACFHRLATNSLHLDRIRNCSYLLNLSSTKTSHPGHGAGTEYLRTMFRTGTAICQTHGASGCYAFWGCRVDCASHG